MKKKYEYKKLYNMHETRDFNIITQMEVQ